MSLGMLAPAVLILPADVIPHRTLGTAVSPQIWAKHPGAYSVSYSPNCSILQNWGNKHKESINSTEHSSSSKSLSNHSNRRCVNLLITDWVQGFLTGVWWLLKVTHICKNLQSALKEPVIVDGQLPKKVSKDYMVGPFVISQLLTTPPF